MRGHLSGAMSKNIFLRLAQYDKWKDKEFKQSFAAAVVKGKISNMRSLLLRYRRNHPEADFDDVLDGLEKSIHSLEKSEHSSAQLLGVEGHSSHIYFQAFKHMLRQDMGFNGRKRRPPPDPVNALLSLTYTMLSNEIACVLEAHSFDPYLGFLHGLRYGRFSLALDMVEEFRQPLADNHVLQLVNLNILNAESFRDGKQGAVLLTEDGFRAFFEQYEKRMGQVAQEDNTGWRSIIIDQVKNLENSVMNDAAYVPYKAKS